MLDGWLRLLLPAHLMGEDAIWMDPLRLRAKNDDEPALRRHQPCPST